MSESNAAAEQSNLLDSDHSKTLEHPPATSASTPLHFTARHRPGYARIPSVSIIDEQAIRTDAPDESDITGARSSSPGHGLGIALGTASKVRRVSIQPAPRATVGMKGTPDMSTPGSADPIISPPSTGGFSGSTRYDGSPREFDTSYAGSKHAGKQSISSLRSMLPPSLHSDTGLASIKSRYDDWEPLHSCRSEMRVKKRVGDWLSITIICLAVFSTVFSALFLILALRGPRYGRMIHTNGVLTAGTAAFLTSFIAKLIELSFVTVLVAFLGQALARRAFKLEHARGVTLAELSMRGWIMQPGTMLTHWQSVRYAGVSALGVISVLGAVSAMLYTSASTALVQPQLKYPKWQPISMQGLVKSSFSNPIYVQSECKTPIISTYDPEYYDSTCIQLEHAAMGYHNYYGYLGIWSDVIHNGSGSSDLAQRPKGFALLNDNTTVTAPWVEQVNITTDKATGALINNISMAMPHPGVIQAAMDPKNNVMQPSELDGLGSYNIRASVPSGVIHVLCVTMSTAQLKPFVYELWDGAHLPVDMTNWQHDLSYIDPYLNGTDFDHIFQWGPTYGLDKWPPIFGKLPINYNTLINDTHGIPWGRDSVYLLGKGGDADSVGNLINDTNYALCQMKVSQTPFCSTQYNASASGGTLEAVCDPLGRNSTTDPLQYIKSLPVATSGNFSVSQDWPNIGSEWGESLSLNTGITDSNGSNSRLLTQLILPQTATKLNPALPSIAEALAVMAGCTLLLASTDAPFVEFWNYTLTTMTPGQYQLFNASIRAQQYTSGYTQNYQKAFYLVLITVFVINVLVLAYFAVHRDWYTDFSEPSNLFSLAVNSPPSKELAGSCGGGPRGEQFNVNWKLNQDGDHVYMESLEKDESAEESPGLRRRRFSEGVDFMLSPIKKASSTFDLRRSRQ